MATTNSRSGSGREQPRRRRSEDDTHTASAAAAKALRYVGELITSDPVGVTSVEPAEDGWLVEVEVIEERRIPSSADMLALYEIELDSGGALLAYRRTRRYSRGRADSRNGAS
jgi:hypothetical protein